MRFRIGQSAVCVCELSNIRHDFKKVTATAAKHTPNMGSSESHIFVGETAVIRMRGWQRFVWEAGWQ